MIAGIFLEALEAESASRSVEERRRRVAACNTLAMRVVALELVVAKVEARLAALQARIEKLSK